MAQEQFTRDNHYVSKAYLRRWAGPSGKVWVYRTLVSHSKVPFWTEASPRGVAYRQHLYTRVVGSAVSDEVEQWLAEEFEGPAEAPLRKATSDSRLSPKDWELLVRFLAAQCVRTPAQLISDLKRLEKTAEDHLSEAMKETVVRLESGVLSTPTEVVQVPYADYIPLGVAFEKGEENGPGRIVAETVLGRGHWLFGIKRLLTGKPLRVLLQHRWTIVRPPDGLDWFTTDDPVVRLNFRSPDDYDFGGGWGSRGTEIMLPLGPQHLLYTQIGDSHPPRRGEKMPDLQAKMVRRVMAEHAHRMVFSLRPDPNVCLLRERSVDPERLRFENEQWRKWHDEQTAAEQAMRGLRASSIRHPAQS